MENVEYGCLQLDKAHNGNLLGLSTNPDRAVMGKDGFMKFTKIGENRYEFELNPEKENLEAWANFLPTCKEYGLELVECKSEISIVETVKKGVMVLDNGVWRIEKPSQILAK